MSIERISDSVGNVCHVRLREIAFCKPTRLGLEEKGPETPIGARNSEFGVKESSPKEI